MFVFHGSKSRSEWKTSWRQIRATETRENWRGTNRKRKEGKKHGWERKKEQAQRA